jgi:DNA-binding transcriptional MerR regulator
VIRVPDYYTAQQLAQTLGIAETAITELQTKGLLQPTVRDGRSFFSARQAHCLRAAVRWARKDKMDLGEAFACVEQRWLAHANAMKG